MITKIKQYQCKIGLIIKKTTPMKDLKILKPQKVKSKKDCKCSKLNQKEMNLLT